MAKFLPSTQKALGSVHSLHKMGVVFTAPRRQRQEDQKFEVILSYIVGSVPAWANEALSKTTIKPNLTSSFSA